MAGLGSRSLVYVLASIGLLALALTLSLRPLHIGVAVIPAAPVVRAQRSHPAPVQVPRIDFKLGSNGQSQQHLAKGVVHRYGFTLKPGQLLHAVVDQDVVKDDAIDVLLKLYRPGGGKLYEIDSPTLASRSEEIFLLADTPGTYYVEIDGAGSEGTYRFRLRSIRWASARDQLNARAERIFYEARALARMQPSKLEEALAGFQEAERLWRTLGKPQRRAEAFRRSGAVRFEQWQFKRSLLLHQQALDLFRQAGDSYMEAAQLVAVGLCKKRLGDLETAEKYYRKAVRIAQKHSYPEVRANALFNLGLLLLQRGDSWNALEACETALALVQTQGMEEQELQLLLLMGQVHVTLGKFQNALSFYERAREVLGSRRAPDDRAQILSRVSELYLNSGDLRNALAYARLALGFREQAGDLRGKAVSLAGMSLILQQQGDFFQAKDLQEQALTIFHQIGDLPSEGVARLNLGHLWLGRKDFRNTLANLDQAVLIARQQGLRENEMAALYEAALAERLRGNPVVAQQRIEVALEILGSLSASRPEDELNRTYVVARQKGYGLLIDLLIKPQARFTPPRDVAASFETSEKSRWRELLSSLTASRLRARVLKRADAAFLAKRRGLEKAIDKAEEVRLQLEQDGRSTFAVQRKQAELLENLKTLDLRLRRKDIWAATASRSVPITLAETQQLLDVDGILLEYHLGDARSFLWLVTPSAIEVFTLPARSVIENRARKLHELLSEGQWSTNQRKAIPLARELSEILLAPVAQRLGSGGIVVVPDGAIHLVPFALLPDPSSSAEIWANIWPVPLLLRHRVSYLPSASVLKAIRGELRDRRPPSGRLAVLADPIFTEPGLSQLPLSRKEALAILSLVPADQRTLKALGEQASRDLVMSGKLGDYQIVHFASHATNHPEHPELSSIVLSQVDARGRPREGRLRLHNIQDLELPANLVVLSACKTALGRDIRGEGYMGLTQGFMYAGAARVVVSLWNVSEESTPRLMERFYHGLLIERKSPAEALRSAQRWMAEQKAWSSPYYWAGFEIHGEWR